MCEWCTLACALTAACYDNQARGLERKLARMWLPEDELPMAASEPDGARLMRQEASICVPK